MLGSGSMAMLHELKSEQSIECCRRFNVCTTNNGQIELGWHVFDSLPNSVIIPLAYRIGLICGSGFVGLENHGSGLKSKKYNWILVMLIALICLSLLKYQGCFSFLISIWFFAALTA